ncbi:ABC transporter ATP-binding protein [Microbacterium sp. BWT-B31]|uniref:ABC transporter ATP-binding protein n=1 Tax=Microbacterium sp. BWT-B31 TaxID=3232072 RepID=UPI003528DEFB
MKNTNHTQAASRGEEPVRYGNTSPDFVLRVVNLEKHFQREQGARVLAIDQVSLDVEPGKMVTILGPSGCGKTTLLRCIAGLESPTGGQIWSSDRLLSSGDGGVAVPSNHREFGMMFQSYAVWPHMSVFGNVSYPLRVRRWSRAKREEKVARVLKSVGISHLADEYPARLSGGQQQRVALARSLVSDPKLILFDEPLSNVDAKVREELRVELLEMQRRIGFAGVYVTHDQEEAMAISDSIMVMSEGRVLQHASPREIYRYPATRFVANFIGMANLWEGDIAAGADSGATRTVTCEMGEISVANANIDIKPDDRRAVVVARPEVLALSRTAPEVTHGNVWSGTLHTEMFRGAQSDYIVEVNKSLVRVRGASIDSDGEPLTSGAAVYISARPEGLRVVRADDA